MPDLGGLEGLTGRGGDVSAKVDFLFEILPEYIDEGYSYTSALQDLRANDFKISTNLFYSVRRTIEGISGTINSIRGLPDSYFPSDADVGLNPDRQDRAYKFIYTATITDSETDQTYNQNFSIQMDSFGSVGELRALGSQYLAENYPQLAEQDATVQLVYGLKKTK